MSEHENISALLALAASGDISPEELRRVQEHLARCEACSIEAQDFALLAEGLRGIPTPQPRAELVARVRSLAEARLLRRPSSSDSKLIALLVGASWIAALATWPVLSAGWKVISGVSVADGGLGTALVFYSLLGFLLACVSAVAVGRHASTTGRTR
jgi:anti-sigma factor RsiW